MEITHIDHINIVVSDIESAKSFFQELGFKLKAEKNLSGDWIDKTVGLKGVKARFASLSLPSADTVIELLEYSSPKGGKDALISQANQLGFRHIAFNVKCIEKWHKKIVDLDIECYSEVQFVPNYRGKKIFYFKGPDGIILEMAEYPEQ